ncbi:7629_t:CDS:2 [Gigaspora margarita]|uniref:7629_t:CDS:1 n=1 Tax=Gigaspora margarita TaxID=4874 RepID=A0ABN7UWB7_GIGMA|nr:7629_t:CDS:2 [Gigaspora margarita]
MIFFETYDSDFNLNRIRACNWCIWSNYYDCDLCLLIDTVYNYITAITPQVLLNDKIYFNDGKFSLRPQNTSVYASDQLFYLDISKSFSTNDISSMPWTDFSSVANLTNRSQSAALGQIGARGDFVNVYDTITQVCSTPSDSKSFTKKPAINGLQHSILLQLPHHKTIIITPDSSNSSNSPSMSIGAIIGSTIDEIDGLILFTAIVVLAVHFNKNRYPVRVLET